MPWVNQAGGHIGAWIGEVSLAEQAMGGKWIMGDKPAAPEGENYPGQNDGSLLIKIYTTPRDKYGEDTNGCPLYPKKSRVREGQWEYVRHMTGSFCCWVGDTELQRCFYMDFAGEGVDIPPDVVRWWHLPADSPEGAGIALFRRLEEWPVKPGCGAGYDLSFWETNGLAAATRLEPPSHLKKFAWRLVIPFVGGCGLVFRGCYSSQRYWLPTLGYGFLSNGQDWYVEPTFVSRGVVIYF